MIFIARNASLHCINNVRICLFAGRPVWEGGQYEGDDTTRFETLRLAMELGVDYVDIELKVRSFEQSNLLCFFNCLDNWNLKLCKWSTNYMYNVP
jgi:3-dehydroquinate dehydratase